MWTAIGCAAMALTATRAPAEALLVIEAESGKVLYAANAAYPWYPASVTKVMTAYAVLRAVKEGRLTLETALPVSKTAAAQQPVKMGFPPGTLVTVDNALKMLMVRSSNDMAVVLAEGVSGSIENFADTMNRHAGRLGMTQSSFVNPNGLPADDQISSARDIAILARALILEFPEYDYYWHIPAIKMGKVVQHNYNTLIGRYRGADGMKTGFICASGFNLVATATRDGRRLIAVVMGAPSSQARAVKAAQLLERGFNSSGALSWLRPSLGTVETMWPINAAPPNLRDEMCGPHRKRPATEDEDDAVAANVSSDSPYAVFLSGLRPKAKGSALLQDSVVVREPAVVYTGPYRQLGTQTAATGPKPKAKAAFTAGSPKISTQAARQTPSETAAGDAKPEAASAKPKPKPASGDGKPKTAAKSAPKDGAPAAAGATTSSDAPKPKKPAPKTTQAAQPMQNTPTPTSQTR
jgi:D-alanyl-D-alanine carboxypeptidase